MASGTSTDRTNAEPSLAQLVGELSSEVGGLITTHLDLVMTETKAEVRKASQAGAMMGAAGILGLAALMAVTLAAGWGLAELMPTGWAFLLVAGVWAILGSIFYLAGRSRLRQVEPKPEMTIRELKEDGEWIRAQRSS